MSTQIKYLKDENGEIFSPIVSSSSVMMRGGVSLEQYTEYTLLYSGNAKKRRQNLIK